MCCTMNYSFLNLLNLQGMKGFCIKRPHLLANEWVISSSASLYFITGKINIINLRILKLYHTNQNLLELLDLQWRNYSIYEKLQDNDIRVNI